MQELLLHFLWRFQYFTKSNLHTTDGSSVQILTPGIYNTDAGPDFRETRILLDTVEWVGHTEIHLKSSDWLQHGHQSDYAYNTVILHVVWQHDQAIYRPDGTPIPTLELASRTEVNLLRRYQLLLSSKEVIPCASQFTRVPAIYQLQALDQALMQRLEEKAGFVTELWHQNGQNWEETAYQLLARTMGFKVNSEPFLRLAKSLPLRILRKHNDSLFQLEAIVFGQAGFLEQSFSDEYPLALQREYRFLARKYQLENTRIQLHEWKFMRLRPANFPTIRIAQFAALLHKHPHLFALFTQMPSDMHLSDALRADTSPYWKNHFLFDKPAKSTGTFGESSITHILINTTVPLLVSYDQQRGDGQYLSQAVHLLENLPAEDNSITRGWKTLGIFPKNAFDSQASIELFNRFCSHSSK